MTYEQLSGVYVLRRLSGGYVAPRGSAKAYAKSKRGARRFASREAAEREACGNEVPEKL